MLWLLVFAGQRPVRVVAMALGDLGEGSFKLADGSLRQISVLRSQVRREGRQLPRGAVARQRVDLGELETERLGNSA